MTVTAHIQGISWHVGKYLNLITYTKKGFELSRSQQADLHNNPIHNESRSMKVIQQTSNITGAGSGNTTETQYLAITHNSIYL